MFSAMKAPAFSSSSPPISPTITTRSVSGSASNMPSTSMNDEPTMGSPPMPTTVLWPMPMSPISLEIWYVSVPERLTMPTRPGVNTSVGMMPTVALPGLMAPGQLGPSRRWSLRLRCVYTRIMSCAGMPSVMVMVRSIPASSDS